MKILITGANGFVGRALVQHLYEQSFDLVLVTRSDSQELLSSYPKAQFVIADFTKNLDENKVLSEVLLGCDVVIHLAARVHMLNDDQVAACADYMSVNVSATEQLARLAIKANVKRFIFLSTVKVNGEASIQDQPFTELDAANPHDIYATSKHLAEQALFNVSESGDMDIVVIRPPLIYGAGVKANFAGLLKILKRGFPLPFAAVNNLRSFVYVENLVDFMMKCLAHPAAHNEVFFVSDGEDVSTVALIRRCADALAVKARLFAVPTKLLMLMAKIVGKEAAAGRLCGYLQVDITKANRLLSWQAPYSMQQGLHTTAKYFDENDQK